MGSVLTLQTTISEQLSAYLIYFIRQQSASALAGYQCHTLTAVTDQPEAPQPRCADLHSIASGVPFLSLLLKVVQHSSPGNYLSIAQKSKDVNSVMLTSNVFVQLEKHLTWVSFQIISFSLPSHQAQFLQFLPLSTCLSKTEPASPRIFLFVHSKARVNTQRQEETYAISLISLDKTFREAKMIYQDQQEKPKLVTCS